MRRLFVIACAAALLPVTAAAQSHTLVALSHEDHTAYEIDPATGQVLHKFTAQNQPHEGVASPDGRTYYLAVPNGPHVVVLDGQSFAQKAIVESPFFKSTKNKGSASPHGIAITDDGRKIYVGLENADVPGIVVIDTATNRVTKKIDVVLQGGHFLAIQPRTGKLYYPMREDHRVLVIDTATDTIAKIIPIAGGPVGVGFAPNGEVWIHNDGDGTVHVIDSAKDEVVKVLEGLGKGAGRMAVSADGRWAASTHGGTQDVALIDARTKEVAATIPLGRGPAFPVFSPDGSKLYVMNSGGGDVAVIDTAAKKVVARHKVGVNPFGGSLRTTATSSRQ
jgi:YVTN family beta-propeller protein